MLIVVVYKLVQSEEKQLTIISKLHIIIIQTLLYSHLLSEIGKI